jgi:hypothetical protein
MFEDADLIHAYTRADALRDGVLIAVSQIAREAGFCFPVALTRAVWERCVAVPPGVACQDEAGRARRSAVRFTLPDDPSQIPLAWYLGPCSAATASARLRCRRRIR